ncbi:MAG: hypothetical protein ACRCSO_05380 [Sphingomonas sp.]
MTGNGDLNANRTLYSGVLSLLKWGAAASLILAFIVVALLRG